MNDCDREALRRARGDVALLRQAEGHFWLRFEERPEDRVRKALHRAGWRWVGEKGEWCGPADTLPPADVSWEAADGASLAVRNAASAVPGGGTTGTMPAATPPAVVLDVLRRARGVAARADVEQRERESAELPDSECPF